MPNPNKPEIVTSYIQTMHEHIYTLTEQYQH